MKLRGALVTFLLALLLPVSTFAFSFGGQAGMVIPCANTVVLAALGPPNPGLYLWSPATVTYRNGPPTHPGQWLLGIAGVPLYCLISVVPLITSPGILISMMGSSQ